MADIILGQHPLLKKEFIDKRVRALIGHQFVADQLFTASTVDALAIKYLQDADKDSKDRQAYDGVPEVGEGSTFQRIGLNEEEKTAMIKKYGLEAIFTYEMQKWGPDGIFERGIRKLAVNVKKMVDTMAYDVATNKYNIGGGIQGATSGGWNTATNVINELVDAKTAGADYGYSFDTLVVNPRVGSMLLKTKDVRDALRENNTDVSLLRGYIGDFMGLSIIQDENFKDGDALVLQKKIIGDIADAEGLRTGTYNEDGNMRTVARATRFTQAYLTDPKASYLLKTVKA
ncbi:phage major capsid protein [Bacillus thuringiensis]|uniref:phage major capsid protein n=1 Tax=Bacillus thuringiensis TaxID=1428 RepID=UPI001FAB92D1|nr:hypothetical protein [Bacillus thuringiensis]MDM8365836.1 hypothetical protein [Bacillus thuringiensis]HDT6579212.1 hypothetical protein [Bacillus cereus]